jgi:Domain of unknown function (DUF4156)
MKKWVYFAVMVSAIPIGCSDLPPITPLAPGASGVRITRNAADVESCTAVGNVDGSHVRRGMYADVTKDQIAIPQLQNQAIGQGGNTVFDTSSASSLTGIVYRCSGDATSGK